MYLYKCFSVPLFFFLDERWERVFFTGSAVTASFPPLSSRTRFGRKRTTTTFSSREQAPASVALAGGENLWQELLKAMGGPYAAMARVPHGEQWIKAGATSSPSDWP